MAPVTRFAAFKYKPGTTNEQKRASLDGLIKLYEDNAHMVDVGPRGGANNSTEGFDKGFDVVFTVVFKSKAHRDEFVPDPAHLAYKESIMSIVEDVIVYDYEEGVFGY
ncbi:hypothetical protein SERLA73DRAFT_150463 [Serpula lacrymans var. lacrymans S7.3]|uniref:Stress-response A/B barrel domain-containing protein n=2 Tax=Serpula lacrymans var. lacrymans TaxID=341189 RepID=F8PMP1_SERL3|nr:uncharacterized protein SERLADRAFT_380430 [Serpula lacrymans var. lacrymans S7.9]EGO02873.1 hypothetical protein SERLA73DRAFT_150463 [Serpula lacrymans var. lacrymans S7.3]EGO28568.1 hypothetical protein SERLADRAFT_380430 [Serpula lacrymans var. lacrymans S7.9]